MQENHIFCCLLVCFTSAAYLRSSAVDSPLTEVLSLLNSYFAAFGHANVREVKWQAAVERRDEAVRWIDGL